MLCVFACQSGCGVCCSVLISQPALMSATLDLVTTSTALGEMMKTCWRCFTRPMRSDTD